MRCLSKMKTRRKGGAASGAGNAGVSGTRAGMAVSGRFSLTSSPPLPNGGSDPCLLFRGVTGIE